MLCWHNCLKFRANIKEVFQILIFIDYKLARIYITLNIFFFSIVCGCVDISEQTNVGFYLDLLFSIQINPVLYEREAVANKKTNDKDMLSSIFKENNEIVEVLRGRANIINIQQRSFQGLQRPRSVNDLSSLEHFAIVYCNSTISLQRHTNF